MGGREHVGGVSGRGPRDAVLHIDLFEAHRWLVFTALPPDGQTKAAKQLASLLEKQGVAYDIAGHRDAPPHLRIWAGATIETAEGRPASAAVPG